MKRIGQIFWTFCGFWLNLLMEFMLNCSRQFRQLAEHPSLQTPRLLLRPLQNSDYERILEFMSVRSVTDFLLFFNYPIKPEEIRNWLQNVIAANKEYCLYWGIVLKKENKLLGILSLTIDNYHHKAEIGCWSDRDYWNRGIMTEAAWIVIEYGFKWRHFHRLEWTHMTANDASQRLAEKLGFQMEGIWREGHYKDGTFRDVKIYGMLASDFERAQKRFREKASPAPENS